MTLIKQLKYFLIGMTLLVAFSLVQKLISGYAIRWDSFIVPVAFGGAAGLVIGNLFRRVELQNRHLRESNEEYSAANEELAHSYNELRGVYKELQVTKHKAGESERLKSSFLSNLSHEIRTPLNGIVGFVQILTSEELEPEERELFIQNILTSTDRLLEIVSNIVEIAKIEAGSVNLTREKINVNSVLKEIFESYQPTARERGLDYVCNSDLPDARALIFCDAEKLKIILRHLVHNALKFTLEGSVTIGASLKNAYVEFFVKDTGIGISEEMQEFIFNRFSQGQGSASTDVTGTGLGLSISKAYVELMGGMLELNSEEGTGSEFSFIIPYDRASG